MGPLMVNILNIMMSYVILTSVSGSVETSYRCNKWTSAILTSIRANSFPKQSLGPSPKGRKWLFWDGVSFSSENLNKNGSLRGKYKMSLRTLKSYLLPYIRSTLEFYIAKNRNKKWNCTDFFSDAHPYSTHYLFIVVQFCTSSGKDFVSSRGGLVWKIHL